MKLPAIVHIGTSTTLPTLLMEMINGLPIIHNLISRINAMTAVNQVIVATSNDPISDEIAAYCHANDISCYRGSKDSALDCVYHCARTHCMDTFAKFYGDSPLIDIFLCDEIITRFFVVYSDVDYLSNMHPNTYPPGMQLEIVRTEALRLAIEAPDLTKNDQEQVTSYLWQHPEQFNIAHIAADTDIHDAYRLVMETPEDLQQLKALITALSPVNPLFSLQDIIQFLDAHPEVKELNVKKQHD